MVGPQDLSAPALCGYGQRCHNATHDTGRTSRHNPPSLRRFFVQAVHSRDAYKHQPKPNIQVFQHVMYQLAGRVNHLSPWRLHGQFHQLCGAG